MLNRLFRALRSRRLAIGLITAVAIWGVLGTLIPLGPPNDPRVIAWAERHPLAESLAEPLGLHHAFSTPGFLLLATLLALSISACALERSQRAVRMWRTIRDVPATAARLSVTAQSAVPLPQGVGAAQALERAAGALAGLGLRVRTGADSVDARAGGIALLGSPLFHWSLVALMVTVGAGQATRAEGFLPLPIGERVADAHENFDDAIEGPLFREAHTGIEFEATELVRRFQRDGVEYGEVPYVIARRGSAVIAEGYVYPNSPLRVGRLMVHMAGFGPAAVLAVQEPSGAEVARETLELDRSEESSVGTLPREVVLSGAPGAPPTRVRVQIVVYRAAEEDRATLREASRAIVATAAVGSDDFGPPVTLLEGESIDLPGGGHLILADVKDWVRVSVANDLSVPWIYALLVVAIVGLAIALLLTARSVCVVAVESEAGPELHVGIRTSRRDPAFRQRVQAALAEEFESQEA